MTYKSSETEVIINPPSYFGDASRTHSRNERHEGRNPCDAHCGIDVRLETGHGFNKTRDVSRSPSWEGASPNSNYRENSPVVEYNGSAQRRGGMFQERKRWELGGVYLSFIDQKAPLSTTLCFRSLRGNCLSTRGTRLGVQKGWSF